MSLQIAAGPGGLMALGVGAGDIASIISLGRRVGNWWTARSGDLEMLALLGEDGSSILKRRGILDMFAFNKRWRKHIRLLANGTPLCLDEKDIKNVMNNVEELLHVSSVERAIIHCPSFDLTFSIMRKRNKDSHIERERLTRKLTP